MRDGVGDRLAQHDLRKARQLIPARAEDHQLGAQFSGDATDGFLEHVVKRSVDLFAAVVVDAGVVRESQDLNERLAEGWRRVRQEVERARHGEALAGRKLGGSQAITGGSAEAQRARDLRAERRRHVTELDVDLCGLVSRARPLVGEAHEFGTEQGIVASAAAHTNDPCRCLREALSTSRDRQHGHGLAVDVELTQSVAADIAGSLHGAVDVVLGAGIERPCGDRAVVLHADQDHAAVGVGERDSRALHLLHRRAALELHMLALARERRPKLGEAHRQGRRGARLGMKQWICQCSRTSELGLRTLA